MCAKRCEEEIVTSLQTTSLRLLAIPFLGADWANGLSQVFVCYLGRRENIHSANNNHWRGTCKRVQAAAFSNKQSNGYACSSWDSQVTHGGEFGLWQTWAHTFSLPFESLDWRTRSLATWCVLQAELSSHCVSWQAAFWQQRHCGSQTQSLISRTSLNCAAANLLKLAQTLLGGYLPTKPTTNFRPEPAIGKGGVFDKGHFFTAAFDAFDKLHGGAHAVLV